MSYINFTPTASNAFQNALGQGLQMGQMAAESANRRGFNNALAAYDPNNMESVQEVMRYNPKVGLELRRDAQAQQAAAQQAETQRAAFGGDPNAMQALAGVDIDAARGLRTDQKQAVALQASQRGQAALMATEALRQGNMEQARAIVANYAQTTEDNEAASILQLPPQEFELQLRTAIAQAEMVEDLFERLDPNFQRLGAGEVFVDTRNPSAVQQFSGGGQQGGFQEGQTAVNPQTGRRIVFRNGNWVPFREGQ